MIAARDFDATVKCIGWWLVESRGPDHDAAYSAPTHLRQIRISWDGTSHNGWRAYHRPSDRAAGPQDPGMGIVSSLISWSLTRFVARRSRCRRQAGIAFDSQSGDPAHITNHGRNK